MGRSYRESYWCGFCVRIIHSGKVRNEAWDVRFSHVNQHYDAGMIVDDWIVVEGNGPKREFEFVDSE